MAGFFRRLDAVYQDLEKKAARTFTDAERRNATDALGNAGADFRNAVYKNGFSGKREKLTIAGIKTFFGRAEAAIDQSIRVNRRPDGLYHAYNLVRFTENGITVKHLYEMLEGQVAVLSSGYLDAKATADLLDAMRSSSLYRADQNSYLLYPDRNLPGFMQKNFIPENLFRSSALLQKLVADGNRDLVVKDVNGAVHFAGSFKNAGDLNAALDRLAGTPYAEAAAAERSAINDIFEHVFNHEAFTGRSGTFFGYEGLGSIYWHMVSKLHLALTEVCVLAQEKGVDAAVQQRLAAHFDAIGAGIGLKKEPALFGAFPVDPYSHTPKHKGAQQPGMTGQVKEDILVRRFELGMRIRKGVLAFAPELLTSSQFIKQPSEFTWSSQNGDLKQIALPAHSLAFTCCRVPVVYTLGDSAAIEVTYSNGKKTSFNDNKLDHATTQAIFKRDGTVAKIAVSVNSNLLRGDAAL
jgi:hypothetical protein